MEIILHRAFCSIIFLAGITVNQARFVPDDAYDQVKSGSPVNTTIQSENFTVVDSTQSQNESNHLVTSTLETSIDQSESVKQTQFETSLTSSQLGSAATKYVKQASVDPSNSLSETSSNSTQKVSTSTKRFELSSSIESISNTQSQTSKTSSQSEIRTTKHAEETSVSQSEGVQPTFETSMAYGGSTSNPLSNVSGTQMQSLSTTRQSENLTETQLVTSATTAQSELPSQTHLETTQGISSRENNNTSPSTANRRTDIVTTEVKEQPSSNEVTNNGILTEQTTEFPEINTSEESVTDQTISFTTAPENVTIKPVEVVTSIAEMIRTRIENGDVTAIVLLTLTILVGVAIIVAIAVGYKIRKARHTSMVLDDTYGEKPDARSAANFHNPAIMSEVDEPNAMKMETLQNGTTDHVTTPNQSTLSKSDKEGYTTVDVVASTSGE